MTEHQEALKHVADAAFTATSAFVVLSHWAELAQPIVAVLVGVLTAVWWIIRIGQILKARKG